MRILPIILCGAAVLAGCTRPPPDVANAESIDAALARADRELANATKERVKAPGMKKR